MTDEPGEPLPDILAQIAAAAGRDAALDFAAEFGGRRLKLPKPAYITLTHPVAQAVGMKAAVAICGLFHGGEISVPFGPDAPLKVRRRRIDALILEGRSADHIAAQTGCSWRTVYRRRAILRDKGRLP